MTALCTVPAKLILSGEHAVLYDCPAISMAIDLPTHCWSTYTPSRQPSVTIELVNYQQKHCLPFAQWKQLSVAIESRFYLFETQSGAIQTVLSKPIDLLLIILHHFDHRYGLMRADWQFKIDSKAPIGRGLGSSAAVIIAVLKSLIHHQRLEVHPAELLALAQLIECRQHGRSSGIDPTTLIHGGLLQYQPQHPIEQLPKHTLHGWLIDTGHPESSTGHCVQNVKQNHANNAALWQTFARTTAQIIQAWSKNDSQLFKQGIAQNHRLLTQIGVVPQRVQEFILALENDYNASAKVCGAGSIEGDCAGMVLCLSDLPPVKLCREYGYSLLDLNTGSRAAQEGAYCEVV
jgi:mevalonate kinase